MEERSITREEERLIIHAPATDETPAEDKPITIDSIAQPADIHSIALTGLFILAVLYSLYFARPVLLPFALALMINFLLRPLIQRLEKIHIPPSLSAILVLLGFVATFGGTGYLLAHPATEWIARAPEITRQVGVKIQKLRKPFERFTKVAEQMGHLADGDGGGANAKPQAPEVKVKQPIVTLQMLAGTQDVLGQFVVVFILLYFLLASGDFFLRKLIKVMPTLSDKKRALKISNEIQHEISRYFLTVTLINAGMGLALGTAFSFIGMPSPYLWGAASFLLNFVPYLGALVGIILTALVALISFDSLGHALLVPAAYLVIATLEGNFITPMILGRRFTLHPVIIFIWLIFWGWLWGVPGALLAVPMLSALKILCDHLEGLHNLGEFLGNTKE